jgi:hypothetical protein
MFHVAGIRRHAGGQSTSFINMHRLKPSCSSGVGRTLPWIPVVSYTSLLYMCPLQVLIIYSVAEQSCISPHRWCTLWGRNHRR